MPSGSAPSFFRSTKPSAQLLSLTALAAARASDLVPIPSVGVKYSAVPGSPDCRTRPPSPKMVLNVLLMRGTCRMMRLTARRSAISEVPVMVKALHRFHRNRTPPPIFLKTFMPLPLMP